MKQIKSPQISILVALITAWCSQGAQADPLALAQYPAGTAYNMPIPNVILSVDTSGSMSSNNDGTSKTRIQWLKEGLQNTLVNQSKYDNKFRLAWQSFACNNIPSNSGNCGNKNTIGIFSGAHKTDFGTWVNALSASGWTPSHELVWNAGQYLMTTGVSSPWNSTPGTADNSPLTCRKAYHIFLTDGGWNRYNEDVIPSFDAFGFQSKMQTSSVDRIGDTDQTTAALPDAKSYDVMDPQTRVYRGAGGGATPTACLATKSGKCTKWGNDFTYPTLSDMAFYFWSKDLQPAIPDKVVPSIVKSGDETFTSGTKNLTLSEYWNPKNDPATWQHLVQYTIGYGKTASAWKNSGSNPLFTNGGMYGSDLTKTILGLKLWTDVTLAYSDNNYDDYRPEDLWHMAINSRGKYFPVSGGDLGPVFDEIFGNIVNDTTRPVTGFTSASGSVSRSGTSSYQSGYVAAETGNLSTDNRWFGYVVSNTISTSGAATPNAAWGVTADGKNVSTSDKLDALSPTDITNRVILSFSDASRQGISFDWGSTSPLSDTQKTLLNRGNTALPFGTTNGDNKGKDRLNFIRGDRTKEANQTGGTFRVRKSRQGDIVNSAIWYAGPPVSGFSFGGYEKYASAQRNRFSMLYVGGNDGMLHGFSANDGAEKIAYVPQGVVQSLAALTDTGYTHQYYVDGSPFTADVKLGSGNTADDWSTYLVGTLGAGGKGFFVLDVTKPGTSDGTISSNFVSSNASTLVVMDKTAYNPDSTDPAWVQNWDDVGYIFGNPVVAETNTQRALQITRTNDGRWALILGNGYNSKNERPVLLIQYLDGDKKLKTIPAVALTSGEAKSNGLSTPQFLDVNGDGIPDFVYAGDLRGNMWKFDLSSSDPTAWGVAFAGSPLFTAVYKDAVSGSSSRQPITTPPVLRPNRDVGGLMVSFGTGRNVTDGDRTDSSKQTLYSILDNTRYAIETSGTGKGKVKVCTDTSGTPPKCTTPSTVLDRNALQQQSIDTGSKQAGTGISTGRAFWKLKSSNKPTYVCDPKDSSCTPQKGWFMDLPEPGERVLAQIEFYDGGNILEIISEVPASGSATADSEEVCTPSPRAVKNFRTLLNISTGMPAGAPLMNVDGNVYTDPSGNTYGIYNTSDAGYARMESSAKELRIATKFEQSRTGADGKKDNLAKLPELLLRPNWRQLQ